MTSPRRHSKVVLALDTRRPATIAGAPIRRFRLARLQLDRPGADPSVRVEGLRRTED